jgi:protein PsiE
MQQNLLTQQAQRLLGLIEFAGLLVIILATIVAGIREVALMLNVGEVHLADLLLLFLYLEILAMVGVYFRDGTLPVRYPMYIAMVALARYLVLDMKNLDEWRMLGVTASIFLLTLAVLAVRYGHLKLSYGDHE